MSEEMKNNLNNEELNKEQLEDAVGGDGIPSYGPGGSTEPIIPTVRTCPICGSPMSKGNGSVYRCPNGCGNKPPVCPKCGGSMLNTWSPEGFKYVCIKGCQ